MSDAIIVTKSCYDDFSSPTPWRSFEFVVQERSLYVNPGWVAELSPFFADEIFGNGQKEPINRFLADDLLYSDLLEFFRCIFYCPMRKPLTVNNVSLVLRIATRFEFRPVRARCEMFISRTAPSLDRNKLFQVTCAMSACDPNSTTMSVLVDRLASMKEEDLSMMQFHEMPGDVVAEVYGQKLRAKQEKRARGKKCCSIM